MVKKVSSACSSGVGCRTLTSDSSCVIIMVTQTAVAQPTPGQRLRFTEDEDQSISRMFLPNLLEARWLHESWLRQPFFTPRNCSRNLHKNISKQLPSWSEGGVGHCRRHCLHRATYIEQQELPLLTSGVVCHSKKSEPHILGQQFGRPQNTAFVFLNLWPGSQ